MALLKSRRDAPPGQWRYFQRETEHEMLGENEPDIVNLVVAHRKYRNLQPQDPELVRLDIHRQICTKLGTQECAKEGREDKWQPINPERERVTMGDVIAFSKAAMAFVTSGGSLVPPEESQRRAAICRACPLNQKMTGCSCNVFYQLLDKTIPAARRIDGMHVCKACHCTLGVKVLLTEEQVVVSNEGRDIQWPEVCWQKDIMAKSAPVSPP